MSQNRMDEFSVAIDPATGDLRPSGRPRWRPMVVGSALVVLAMALGFLLVVLLEAA